MPDDKQVALALIQEVEEKVNEVLGNQIALPIDLDNFDAKRANFCEKMVKQCELAEKKAPNDNEVLTTSYILRAQLYGCWQKPQGVRGTHNKAGEFYDKALAMPGIDEARLRYRYALFCRVSRRKQKAIENFKRVIELAGTNSDLGVECAKELAKEQEKKGGCFIATAVYGSYSTDEVMILRQFRDDFLLKNVFGRLFVKFYYLVSPPLASFIATREAVRERIRIFVLEPIVKLIKGRRR